MTETLAYGYSSESTQQALSNEYQHDRVQMVFKKTLHPCDSDKSRLNIGKVKHEWVKNIFQSFNHSSSNIFHYIAPWSLTLGPLFNL